MLNASFLFFKYTFLFLTISLGWKKHIPLLLYVHWLLYFINCLFYFQFFFNSLIICISFINLYNIEFLLVLILHYFWNIICLCELINILIYFTVKYRFDKGIFLFLKLKKLTTLKGVIDLRGSICAQGLLIKIVYIIKYNRFIW